MYVEHHPKIKSRDFKEMRAHYKDYLRSKNYGDDDVKDLLTDFDIALGEKDYHWIYETMESIGVVLKGEKYD